MSYAIPVAFLKDIKSTQKKKIDDVVQVNAYVNMFVSKDIFLKDLSFYQAYL